MATVPVHRDVIEAAKKAAQEAVAASQSKNKEADEIWKDIAALDKAVKDQQAKIKQLEARIAQLEKA